MIWKGAKRRCQWTIYSSPLVNPESAYNRLQSFESIWTIKKTSIIFYSYSLCNDALPNPITKVSGTSAIDLGILSVAFCPILTLVIYFGCRSLIKLVSDATKQMSQSCYVYVLFFCWTLHYLPIRLLRNNTANFCSDQILSQILRTQSMIPSKYPLLRQLVENRARNPLQKC